MSDGSQEIMSRPARLHAYLAHNRDQILVDALVIVAWLIGTWTIFGAMNLPPWLFYLVLFIGVIIYSRLTPPWTRPYRSPDLEADSEKL